MRVLYCLPAAAGRGTDGGSGGILLSHTASDILRFRHLDVLAYDGWTGKCSRLLTAVWSARPCRLTVAVAAFSAYPIACLLPLPVPLYPSSYILLPTILLRPAVTSSFPSTHAYAPSSITMVCGLLWVS